MKVISGYLRAVRELSIFVTKLPRIFVPKIEPAMTNAKALINVKDIAPNDMAPPASAYCSVRARATKARMSSMTAAPIMALAVSVCNFPISFRTFAVIAVLVAVSAVPMKTALASS